MPITPDGDELKKPVNDARDLGAKLKGYGFDITVAGLQRKGDGQAP
jgi:hypothetical protein